ncbi:MAG: transposase [Betaproteobacteria bacterium]
MCNEEHIQDDFCEEAFALLIEILEWIAKDDDNITRTPLKQRRCKIESVYHLDARYAKKTPETGYVGYKAHMAVSAESRFIIHTETAPTDVGDPTVAPVVVDGVFSHGLDFSKAIGDTQYGSGKFRLQVRLTAIALNIKRIFTLLQEQKASALAEPEAA